jgi:hypothetical protein
VQVCRFNKPGSRAAAGARRTKDNGVLIAISQWPAPPQLSAQRQLAGEFVTIELPDRDLFRRRQNPQCDGQIETTAFLRQLRRRQIDRDASRRKFETAIEDRGANTLAALLHLGFGQPDNSEGRQAIGQIDLHGNGRRFKTGECAAVQDGKRHG